MHWSVWANVPVDTQVEPRTVMGCPPLLPLLYYIELGSLIEPEARHLCEAVWPASSQNLPDCALWGLRHTALPSFLEEQWGLKNRSSCVQGRHTSTLAISPPPLYLLVIHTSLTTVIPFVEDRKLWLIEKWWSLWKKSFDM